MFSASYCGSFQHPDLVLLVNLIFYILNRVVIRSCLARLALISFHLAETKRGRIVQVVRMAMKQIVRMVMKDCESSRLLNKFLN
jgi:hypothetical protein